MDTILSFSNWYNFIFERLILDAIFIPFFILLIFTFFKRYRFEKTPALRFIITAAIITLLSRYVHFVCSATRINTRYLFTTAFYFLILSLPGYFMLAWFLKKITNSFSQIKTKHIHIILLSVIAIACVGKALKAPTPKDYIHNIAQIIKKYSQSDKALLFCNIHDPRRIAWHADAEYRELGDVIISDSAISFKKAINKLTSHNQTVFLLLDFRENEFRDLFRSQSVEYPDNLDLLGEFRVKKEVYYSLYRLKK